MPEPAVEAEGPDAVGVEEAPFGRQGKGGTEKVEKASRAN